MMRFYFFGFVCLTFLCVCFPFFLSAQKIDILKYKKWTGENLSWTDFKGNSYPEGNHVSQFSYKFESNFGKFKFSDTTIQLNKVSAIMDKRASWVVSDARTDLLLKYNQTIFNFLELERRKLQNQLVHLPKKDTVETKYWEAYHELEDELERLKYETEEGTNAIQVDAWHEYSIRSLDESKEKLLPEYSLGNFAHGPFFGIGPGLFTSTIHQHFSNTFNLSIGYGFSLKNFQVNYSTILGNGRVTDEYAGSNTWLAAIKTSLIGMELSFGYSILDSRKIKVSPLLGYGYMSIYANEKDRSYDEYILESHNLLFGITMDYKLKKVFKLIPEKKSGGPGSYKEFCIRTRFFATPLNFSDDLKGTAINCSIGLSGMGRRLKLQE